MKLSLPALGRPCWTADPPWTPDWEVEGVHERRLGRASVRFAGFSPKRIARNLRKFDLTEGSTPVLLELRDVVFLPGRRCLYRLDGSRVEESKWTFADPDAAAWNALEVKAAAMEERHMPAAVEIPAELERETRPVLYMGELKQHYGHFLTDGMARLWALERYPADWKCFFHLDPVTAMRTTPHIQLVMEALGVPAARMIWPREPTLFSRMICPVPAIQLSRRIYRAFDRPHRIAGEALARGVEAPRRPVYLSRRGLGEAHRRLEGEDVLERRLEAEGYLIVQPETLDLPHQIALFRQDQPVVGASGSALHTVLFRNCAGQKLGVLTAEDVAGRFPLIDMVKANRTTYANCMVELTEAENPNAVRLQERSWRIDADRAMDFLRGAGFFAGRWR